jgi:hypothetical protein
MFKNVTEPSWGWEYFESKYLATVVTKSPFQKILPRVNFLKVHLTTILYFEQTFGRSSTSLEKIHINMCPKICNLRVIAENILRRHQQQFSINVLAGIADVC